MVYGSVSPNVSDVPISLKYARIERERRFLVRNQFPVSGQGRRLHIRDYYLIGTTMRLRSVAEDGKSSIFKLGQKIRIDKDQPSTNVHTTMYISKEEFDLLAQLPANTLEKVRRIEDMGDFNLSIDEFGAHLTGLVLAEIDLGSTGTFPDTFPFDIDTEVTNDERFTGGELAKMTPEVLSSILDS
jgi:CYTH domain-containing protein